jgi:hypothetical protein
MLEKPRAVVDAINLLWITIAIGGGGLMWAMFAHPQVFSGGEMTVQSTDRLAASIDRLAPIVVVTYLFLKAVLVYKIFKGQNWAKTLFLALTVISLFGMPANIQKAIHNANIASIIALARIMRQS